MLMYRDADLRPNLFFWNGPIAPERLESWLVERRLEIPGDLFEFWLVTGGGDIFETETILGPFGDVSMGDDVDSANLFYHEQGLPANCLLFHTGMGGLSAVRLSDNVYLLLDETNYHELKRFASLEDWYERLPREEYAERYGLPVS